MKQEAEKIINIEHADNVHIDVPDLFGMAENLKRIADFIPEIMEYTVMLPFTEYKQDDITNENAHPFFSMSSQNACKDTIEIGDIVMSHWQIDQCIGKGSISTVYEAHHIGTQYRSAIKVIRSSFQYFDVLQDDATHRVFDASEMIQMELDNMVKLRGNGYIVEYEDHETFQTSDGPQNIIIRMELLQPLSDRIHTKTLSRADVIHLGIDICKALEFCNKENIIHCDVKPSNIFLTKWGGYKLGDFSASTKNGEPRNPGRIGTLKYMAPEVYAGKPFSSNIDTYSLGLVMYELLKQTTSSEEDDLAKRFSGAPLPSIPEIDQPLQSIIHKACSYNPEDRFSSPTDMLNELLKVK